MWSEAYHQCPQYTLLLFVMRSLPLLPPARINRAGIGVSGIMQNVRLMCLSTIDENDNSPLGFHFAALRAFDYAIKQGVDVINNS